MLWISAVIEKYIDVAGCKAFFDKELLILAYFFLSAWLLLKYEYD